MISLALSAAESRATGSSSRRTISRATMSTGSSNASARSADGFDLRLGFLFLRARGDQLVDLAPVHVDDLERPAVVLEGLAGLGKMLEDGQRESGNGRIIAVIGHADAEAVGEQVGACCA